MEAGTAERRSRRGPVRVAGPQSQLLAMACAIRRRPAANLTTQPVNVFAEIGGTTSCRPLAGAGSTTFTFGPEAQTMTFQLQGSSGLAMVHIAEVDRAADCHFQFEAVEYPQ
jgi:hypothetical protein